MIQMLQNITPKNDNFYLLFQGEKDQYKGVSIIPFSKYLEK